MNIATSGFSDKYEHYILLHILAINVKITTKIVARNMNITHFDTIKNSNDSSVYTPFMVDTVTGQVKDI